MKRIRVTLGPGNLEIIAIGLRLQMNNLGPGDRDIKDKLALTLGKILKAQLSLDKQEK